MLVVTSCDYYHLSFRTQEPFSPNPLWLGVFIFCVKIPSKPAGAWDGTKAVPVTVSQELANLNSNFSWKLIRALDISSNENVDVPYNSNDVHEFMISYGIKNGEQSYGGAVVTIAASEIKPCFCPVYVNDSSIATVYILNFKNDKKILLSRYSGTDTIRCWVYYR